jgi:hypothetical protein
MKIGRTFITMAAVLAATCLSAVPVPAQRVDPQRLFELTLQLPDQVMQATLREGQPLKLTLQGTDEFELIPVVDGRDERRVTLAVYRATANQPGTRRLAERMALTVGTPSTLRSHTGIQVVVDRIRRAPTPTAVRPAAFAPGRRLTTLVNPESCCVCCGQSCACACGVVMSCGSCCMAGCCGGGGGGGEMAAYERYLGTGRACETRFGAPRPAATLRTASR